MKTRSTGLFICIGWLFAVGVGLAVVMDYGISAGHMGETPSAWPKETRIALDAAQPTLVMFAHPKCPCTHASLGELNRLLAKCDNRPAVHIFFLKPEGQTDDWVKGDLWRSAANIPGLVLHEDAGGHEAKHFGAQTSGHVVLYDPRGRLLFKGGITVARGHAGNNAGENGILALLSGQDSILGKQTPVFGCALREASEVSAK
jgi:hypothetical protein